MSNGFVKFKIVQIKLHVAVYNYMYMIYEINLQDTRFLLFLSLTQL